VPPVSVRRRRNDGNELPGARMYYPEQRCFWSVDSSGGRLRLFAGLIDTAMRNVPETSLEQGHIHDSRLQVIRRRRLRCDRDRFNPGR
jgi:hypothetical protein